MKKIIPPLVILIIIVVVARDHLPGFKNKVDKTVAAYVGWTPEAREDNPVGYIEYAEKELKANIAKFQEAEKNIGTAKSKAQASLDEYRRDHAAAVQFSEDARKKYKAAEAATDGNGYPVELLGKPYNHDQLIEQVQSILAERDLYADMTTQFEGLIANLDEKGSALRTQIKTTEFSLEKLAAQKSIVEIQQITSDVEDVLAKVNEVLGENAEAIERIQDPVRSIDDLKKELEGKGDAATKTSDNEVLSFLET